MKKITLSHDKACEIADEDSKDYELIHLYCPDSSGWVYDYYMVFRRLSDNKYFQGLLEVGLEKKKFQFIETKLIEKTFKVFEMKHLWATEIDGEMKTLKIINNSYN